MATSYPSGLDSFSNPVSTDLLTNPSHADQHTNANDAIEAIEAELGINPSASDSTVAARLTPGCLQATRSTSVQSVPEATTTIIFNSITNEDDENGEITLNTSTGVVTINRTGWYHIEASILLSGGTTGYRALSLAKNGTDQMATNRKLPNATIAHTVEVSKTLKLTATDTIEITLFHNNGSNLSVDDDERTYLTVARIR